MRSSVGILLLAVMTSGCSRSWDEFAVASDAGSSVGGSAGMSTGGAPSGGSSGTGGGAATGGSPASCDQCDTPPCVCAPDVPASWQPARFVELAGMNTEEPACPAGWGDGMWFGAEPEDTGCTDCGCAPQGGACQAEVTFFASGNCTQPELVSTVPGGCASPPSGTSVKSVGVKYKLQPGDCASTATPKAPTFKQSYFVCRAEAAPAACGACVPASTAPFSPRACVLRSGASPDDLCPEGYPARYELGTAADLADNRSCVGCSCATPVGGTCQNGSLAMCAATACGQCGPGIPIGCYDGKSVSLGTLPSPTGLACAAGSGVRGHQGHRESRNRRAALLYRLSRTAQRLRVLVAAAAEVSTCTRRTNCQGQGGQAGPRLARIPTKMTRPASPLRRFAGSLLLSGAFHAAALTALAIGALTVTELRPWRLYEIDIEPEPPRVSVPPAPAAEPEVPEGAEADGVAGGVPGGAVGGVRVPYPVGPGAVVGERAAPAAAQAGKVLAVDGASERPWTSPSCKGRRPAMRAA